MRSKHREKQVLTHDELPWVEITDLALHHPVSKKLILSYFLFIKLSGSLFSSDWTSYRTNRLQEVFFSLKICNSIQIKLRVICSLIKPYELTKVKKVFQIIKTENEYIQIITAHINCMHTWYPC